MSFSNALASNAGGSISGQPGPAADPLSLVNRIKDREKQDFQDKANFHCPIYPLNRIDLERFIVLTVLSNNNSLSNNKILAVLMLYIML